MSEGGHGWKPPKWKADVAQQTSVVVVSYLTLTAMSNDLKRIVES